MTAGVRAMAREAVKDIRQTMHETYFGKPEHASEPGTPLNPTMQMVTEDLRQDAHLADYQPSADAKQPEPELDRE